MPIIKKDEFIDASGIIKNLQDIRNEIDLLKKSSQELQTQTRNINKEGTGAEAKKRIDLTKQLETATAKLASAQTKEAQELAKLKALQAEENKILRTQAKESLGLTGAYDKQSRQLNEMRKAYRDLILIQGKETKQSVKLRNEIQKLDRQLKKVDATMGQHQRSVGNYGNALKGVGKQLLAAGGIVGGVTLLAGAISDGINVFKEFDKSVSNLAAILGTTKDGISELSEQAKQLGATTAFTASEVISLQTELAKLGFTQKQIKSSTEGILALAAATGSDLASSAELAGATLRIFNLDASEMSRVTDVLAKSTTISSLSMEKLATIIPTVGKTAQLAGVSLEETAALAGTLTDRGLDASTAATSLRNIFLELSNKGLTWNQAMQKINNSADKNKTAMDLFGKRAAAAGSILAETAENTANLTTQLNNSSGAAQQMADVMLDNLAGDLTIARSAWEGFILSLEDGNGIISIVFRGIVQSGTGLLNMLTALNTEYTNSAIKAQEMGKAASDVIPFWETQISTLEVFLPLLKKAREESERIANLRAKNISGLKKENTDLKTYIFNQAILTGQQAQEVNELIKKLRYKKENNELNKVESALLNAAIDKIKEYNKYQALANLELEKGKRKRKSNNISISDETKEIRKAREEYEKLIKARQDASLPGGQVQQVSGITNILPDNNIGALKDMVNLELEIQAEKYAKQMELAREFQRFWEEMTLNSVETVSSQINEGIQQDTQFKLDAVKNRTDREKKILEQQLQDGLISEAEFRQKTAELDKKANKETAKIQKESALYQIGVDTASAIVKALASAPPPANFINAGIVAAQGALQAALVAAKPLPSFGEGGEIGGRLHSEGGTNINAERGEYVISRKGYSKAPLTTQMINSGLLADSDLNNIIPLRSSLDNKQVLSELRQMNTHLGNLGWTYEDEGYKINQRANGGITKKIIRK